ncbi:sensor domain-containing diguanylate cyclase [Thiohalorhabdus sp.]|uniref:sensor domain-containing diguanylate cyclase n=1 Tax=Thiohalorhabdus sp. TaxID=3094134 RepID=UPI002FC2AC82
MSHPFELNQAQMAHILEAMGAGVLVVDPDFRIVFINHFMLAHAGRDRATTEGRSLFDCFPEVPESWFRRKARSVFSLGHRAFSSWRQRPYLFHFHPNRPVTGHAREMRQDATFDPIYGDDGQVAYLALTVLDVTETSIYQERADAANRQLEEISIRDGLTGLFNRRHLENRLEQEFKRSYRMGSPLSVLLLDADHFKFVNDTYGHQAGDEVLRTIGALLQEALRSFDLAGRYGGEEFVVVLPQTDLEGAEVVAERIRQRLLQEQFAADQGRFSVTVSVGLGERADGVESPDHLLKSADEALFEAKASGRNRIVANRQTA